MEMYHAMEIKFNRKILAIAKTVGDRWSVSNGKPIHMADAPKQSIPRFLDNQ